jgi:hypothetical protein
MTLARTHVASGPSRPYEVSTLAPNPPKSKSTSIHGFYYLTYYLTKLKQCDATLFA